MLGDRAPDNPLLAICLRSSIQTKQHGITNNSQATTTEGAFAQAQSSNKTTNQGARSHSETTNPSGEQATIDQVQGSTELMSHPAITPFSSRIRLFTAISAATGTPRKAHRAQLAREHPPRSTKSANPNPAAPANARRKRRTHLHS